MGIDKDKEAPFSKGCIIIPRSSCTQTLSRTYESSFCPNIFLIPFSRGSSTCLSNQLSVSGFGDGGGGGGGGGDGGCGITGGGGGGWGGVSTTCGDTGGGGAGFRLSGSDCDGIWSTCPGLMRLGSFPITCLF